MPADPAALDVITLVLDDDLTDAPRGTGVLVAANVPGVAAKAMTHSTAKWAWLRAAAGYGQSELLIIVMIGALLGGHPH